MAGWTIPELNGGFVRSESHLEMMYFPARRVWFPEGKEKKMNASWLETSWCPHSFSEVGLVHRYLTVFFWLVIWSIDQWVLNKPIFNSGTGLWSKFGNDRNVSRSSANPEQCFFPGVSDVCFNVQVFGLMWIIISETLVLNMSVMCRMFSSESWCN